MHEWHPLPPPAMVPVMFVNSQAFQLGFQAGCVAAVGFVLSLLVWFTVGYFFRKSLLPRAVVPALAVFALSCLAALPASALVPGTYTLSLSPGGSHSFSGSWAVLNDSHVYVTSGSPQGWSTSFSFPVTGSPSVTFTLPSGSSIPPSEGVYIEYHGPQGSFDTSSFQISAAPPAPPAPSPPPTSSSPCTSSYPASVAPLLGSAPSPCAYFQASQGFNASSAPLILAVLAVLMVILAIWLGHDTIMSIFRRLATGMTGGN